MRTSHRIGVALAVLAAFGFSFKAILVKLAYPYGVDAVTLLALRMAFALPVFLWVGFAASKGKVPLSRRDWLPSRHWVRSATMAPAFSTFMDSSTSPPALSG